MIAVGVPMITLMSYFLASLSQRSSQSKSNLPSLGSNSTQENSATRTTLKPASCIICRSVSQRSSGQCSG